MWVHYFFCKKIRNGYDYSEGRCYIAPAQSADGFNVLIQVIHIMKTLITAVILGLFSLSSIAATEVQTSPSDGHGLHFISADGFDLTSVEEALNIKAEAAGANYYRITSISGNNLLHGTAVIYK